MKGRRLYTRAMDSPTVVHVAGLRKTYGRTVAVDDVSFEVQEGEIFGLIGPNGAGKTTTMECACGLRRPDRGTVSILGQDPQKQELQNRIGVQLQQAQLQKRIKVWEAVDLWAALYPRAVDGDELLERLGLTAKRDAWFVNLSGGQKQRLFIALALINDPELVFLDELTTGLDPQARRTIWSLVTGIRDQGRTVLLTTHLMEEAERLCDRVAIVEHGRVIEIDTPEALVRRHCPQRTVVFSFRQRSSGSTFHQRSPGSTGTWDGDAEGLRGLTGLDSVDRDGETYTLAGRGEGFVTEVIRFLSENRVSVHDFRTILPTLEDVFLELTGHGIRD